MRIPFSLLVLLLPFLAPAQYDNLLRQKDILWIAEAEVLISFDPYTEANIPGFLEAVPVKVMQEENFTPSPSPVTQGLIELMEAGRWPAFADAGLTQPLSREAARAQMAEVDTIVTFDPETYEEKMMVVRNEMLGSTSVFALRQLWYYNGRTDKLESLVLAIAPTWNGGEMEADYRPLAWFQVPAAEKKLFKLESKAVPYATFLKLDLAERDLTVLKGADSPLKAILFDHVKSGRINSYDGAGQAIPPAQVPALFSSVDTIITFDPETYEETIELVQWDFNPEDVGNYRLKQTLFFDPRQGKLQCRPEAVAPTIAITDEYGQLKYFQPLFYWKRE